MCVVFYVCSTFDSEGHAVPYAGHVLSFNLSQSIMWDLYKQTGRDEGYGHSRVD